MAPQLVIDDLARIGLHDHLLADRLEQLRVVADLQQYNTVLLQAKHPCAHSCYMRGCIKGSATEHGKPKPICKETGLTVQLARQKGLLGVILFMKALTGLRISWLNSGTGS